jgi:hypothetical protein
LQILALIDGSLGFKVLPVRDRQVDIALHESQLSPVDTALVPGPPDPAHTRVRDPSTPVRKFESKAAN